MDQRIAIKNGIRGKSISSSLHSTAHGRDMNVYYSVSSATGYKMDTVISILYPDTVTESVSKMDTGYRFWRILMKPVKKPLLRYGVDYVSS